MITVYHLKEPSEVPDLAERIKRLKDGTDPEPGVTVRELFKAGVYERVAVVDTRSHDVAFARTQSTSTRGWWDYRLPKDTTPTRRDRSKYRDTRVWDAFKGDWGDRYVTPDGFEAIPCRKPTPEEEAEEEAEWERQEAERARGW